MTIPVLQTKLHIPVAQPQIVLRARLIERLNQPFRCKLTLISAPAGFGKTTLVSEWLATYQYPVSWIALDKDDGQTTRFLTYLVYGIRKINPAIGTGILDLLQSPQTPAPEVVLTALLNEIAENSDEFVLVLDDYHLAADASIDHVLAFLLEHLPRQMHLIVITREDPDFALARLRSHGQLNELRTSDLRFTASEAREFLNHQMGLKLSEADIQSLTTRTEGWIAGLQLAAISMQGKADASAFVQSFTGTHRFVMDYLLEEVLEQQTPTLKTFLLYTSILERFCGDLCDALIPGMHQSGQDMLEQLEKANLFLVPLDDERGWYRYHHLFTDLLRQRLGRLPTSADAVSINALHGRASEWYETHGYEIDAFQHAVQAHDIDRAEHLIAGNGMPLHFRGAGPIIMSWLSSLPNTVLEQRPYLWVTYAMVMTFSGQPLQDVHHKLEAAETILQTYPQDELTRDLIGQIAAIRAMLAIPHNRAGIIEQQSRRALEFLHPDNLPVRTNSAWTLAYAYQAQGKHQAASQAYTEVIRISEASGNMMTKHAALLGLGGVQEAQNQLYLAAETLFDAIRSAGDPSMPGLCTAHWSLAKIYYEWNDLDIAQRHAQESIRLGQMLETVEIAATAGIVLARVLFAQGKLDEAINSLQDAEAFLHQHHFPETMSEVAAEQVRIALHRGDHRAALDLAEHYDVPFSRVRVHLAQEHFSTALEKLARLRSQAEQNDRVGELLKLRALEVVALHLDDKMERAIDVLEKVLLLAEPGGFIRLFLDEGLPMKQVLSAALKRGMMPDYIRKILAAFDTEESLPPPPALTDPLSERELEILKLVAEGFSNQEISERLFLALDTIKGNNRRIFAKLQVQRRTEAVARARELGLI